MKKFLVMACIACFTVMGSTAAAHAAPPSNDEITGATPITALPFTDVTSNAEAVYSEGDPNCGVATVWYQFTPSEDGRYRFTETFNTSDYWLSPSLALATGDPANLELLVCESAYYYEPSVDIIHQLTAGQTYYVAAGTCCASYGSYPGQVGPGADLTFTAQKLPAELGDVSVTTNQPTVDRYGLVTITGTITCDQAGRADVYLRLQQRFQRTLADGYGYASVECGPSPAPWTMSFSSSSQTIFATGQAQLSGSVTGYDPWDGWVTEEIPTQSVRIRNAR
jgi:hypothetical protein